MKHVSSQISPKVPKYKTVKTGPALVRGEMESSVESSLLNSLTPLPPPLFPQILELHPAKRTVQPPIMSQNGDTELQREYDFLLMNYLYERVLSNERGLFPNKVTF